MNTEKITNNTNHIRITLMADMQYNIRNKFNPEIIFNCYDSTNKQIEQILKDNKSDVYVIAGDFCEYDKPNDSERLLMYQHLGNVLNIDSLKELVVMNGNHDIQLGKQIDSENIGKNPLNTFIDGLQIINPDLYSKVTYLHKQKDYQSKISDKLKWISYSLEDGNSTGNNLNDDIVNNSNNKYLIPIFHDILKEYVDDKNLPVKKSRYNNLMELSKFIVNENCRNNIVLAGDIHDNWGTTKIDDSSKQARTFLYSGSPIQRNFGEGTYCKVTKSGKVFKPAQTKVIKQIDLFIDETDITNTYFEITELPLHNQISYIKFDLNTEYFCNDWEEQINLLISDLFNQNLFGRLHTIVKVELSNLYMNYESEILNIIADYFISNGFSETEYNISLEYGQIIFETKNPIEITKTIEVIDEETGEVIQKEIQTNIDDESDIDYNDDSNLILSEEQLTDIFGQLLNNQKKSIEREFGDNEITESIINEIKSIFVEQLGLSYGSGKSFNIKLIDIETNGFMILGKNKINLNIPALTRIKANNGTGKTTLYNMIRWVLTGMVIEGLPKNTKKENNLLVFNYENPYNDNVIVKLTLMVNGTKVDIYRNVVRTWKPKTTEEDKKSLGWKEYIDDVKSNLKLVVYKINTQTNEVTEIVQKDVEAQQTLDLWFKNVINNILIINQFKILELLNSNGTNLRETILEYIGVDYLKALEMNLETIKEQYKISKPTTSLADIITLRKNTNNQLEEIRNNYEHLELNQAKFETQINANKAIVEIIVEDLISLGDIPTLINNKQIDIEQLSDKINSFELKQHKTIPTLDELIKPIKDESIMNKLKSDIDLFKLDLEEKTNDYISKDYINSFGKLKKSKLESISKIISDLEIKLNTIVSETETKYNNEFDTTYTKLIQYKSELKNHIELYWNDKLSIDKESLSNIRLQYQTTSDKLNSIDSILKNNRNKLDNSVCSSCGSILNLSEEELNKLKVQVKNDTEIFNQLNQELTDHNNKINSIETNIDKINRQLNSDIILISNLFINKDINTISDDLTRLTSIDSNLNIAISDLTIIQDLKDIVTELTSIEKVYIEYKNNDIESNNIKQTINDLQLLTKTLLEFNIESTSKELLEKIKEYKFLKELSDLYLSNSISKAIIDNLKNDLSLKEKELYQLESEYNQKLIEYNNQLESHNKLVSEITQYNQSINEHNNKLQLYHKQLEKEKIELDLLKSKEVKWNELNQKHTEVKNELIQIELSLKKVIADINDNKQNESVLNSKLNEYSILENQWKEYRKKNFIYKTFETLIKKDLKQTVFNYYRKFLNNKLNILLEGLDFRLFWNEDSNLYMAKIIRTNSGESNIIYLPVKLSSGMQTAFLGLSLIYCFHLLNIKNNVSHIFIDEISGQLNDGKHSTNKEETNNYQEKLILLLNKFTEKNIFIIDHIIDNLFETHTYKVISEIDENNNKFAYYV